MSTGTYSSLVLLCLGFYWQLADLCLFDFTNFLIPTDATDGDPRWTAVRLVLFVVLDFLYAVQTAFMFHWVDDVRKRSATMARRIADERPSGLRSPPHARPQESTRLLPAGTQDSDVQLSEMWSPSLSSHEQRKISLPAVPVSCLPREADEGPLGWQKFAIKFLTGFMWALYGMVYQLWESFFNGPESWSRQSWWYELGKKPLSISMLLVINLPAENTTALINPFLFYYAACQYYRTQSACNKVEDAGGCKDIREVKLQLARLNAVLRDLKDSKLNALVAIHVCASACSFALFTAYFFTIVHKHAMPTVADAHMELVDVVVGWAALAIPAWLSLAMMSRIPHLIRSSHLASAIKNTYNSVIRRNLVDLESKGEHMQSTESLKRERDDMLHIVRSLRTDARQLKVDMLIFSFPLGSGVLRFGLVMEFLLAVASGIVDATLSAPH